MNDNDPIVTRVSVERGLDLEVTGEYWQRVHDFLGAMRAMLPNAYTALKVTIRLDMPTKDAPGEEAGGHILWDIVVTDYDISRASTKMNEVVRMARESLGFQANMGDKSPMRCGEALDTTTDDEEVGDEPSGGNLSPKIRVLAEELARAIDDLNRELGAL